METPGAEVAGPVGEKPRGNPNGLLPRGTAAGPLGIVSPVAPPVALRSAPVDGDALPVSPIRYPPLGDEEVSGAGEPAW